MCLKGGFTYDLKIYCGREKVDEVPVPTSMLIYFRLCYVDNYYTSVKLTHELPILKTHLVGRLKKDQKNNPKYVFNKKLKKGERYSQGSSKQIVVTKWLDKGSTYFIYQAQE